MNRVSFVSMASTRDLAAYSSRGEFFISQSKPISITPSLSSRKNGPMRTVVNGSSETTVTRKERLKLLTYLRSMGTLGDLSFTSCVNCLVKSRSLILLIDVLESIPVLMISTFPFVIMNAGRFIKVETMLAISFISCIFK